MKKIVIDAGHGGYDPGAVNGFRYEKDDNLRLALAVRQRLEQQGQQVIMTRSTDEFIPLSERSAISNRSGADIFVSLHRNSSTNPSANGVEIIVQNNAPAANTLYARNVLDQIVKVGVQSNRGVKEGNFAVLRNTFAPAMLIELGFISNARDNELFDQNLDAYATAIANGILLSLGEPTIGAPPATGSPGIRSIQNTLNSRYNAGLSPDGIYGPATRRALIRGIQIELNQLFDAGLSVDGVFGPATRAAIPLLRRGARGNLVYLLQAALYVKGYRGSLDGIFGPETERLVRQFQQDQNLTPDGIAGPITFARLFG